MSFILAGCGLLLAMLAGIAFEDTGIRRRRKARRDGSRFDAW